MPITTNRSPPSAVHLETALSLFGNRAPYDRKRILSEAERAHAKGNDGRAVALYRQLLAAEPRNIELHYRVAPLLAKRGHRFDAWYAFQQVAEACRDGGRPKKALAVYQQATRLLPDQYEAWAAAARLQIQRGEKQLARELLVEGSQQMKGRRLRPQAIALLRAALDLDPWNTDTVLELSALLARSRQREEARWLLERLTDRVRGSDLVRVRARQWRMEPSLRHAWYWIRDGIRARRARRNLPATA